MREALLHREDAAGAREPAQSPAQAQGVCVRRVRALLRQQDGAEEAREPVPPAVSGLRALRQGVPVPGLVPAAHAEPRLRQAGRGDRGGGDGRAGAGGTRAGRAGNGR